MAGTHNAAPDSRHNSAKAGVFPAIDRSADSPRVVKIDAHHHLWHYTAQEYDWIGEDMAALRRSFLPADLEMESQSAGVSGTVVVQARQTVEETHWLLETAASTPMIHGVVGWLPIASASFEASLEETADIPLLKGLRHVVQAEPAGFLDNSDFNRGIGNLSRLGLTYDILIYARQLEETIQFVDRHPNQCFVLDHIAKPDIRHGETCQWKAALLKLAQRENVSCKLSGMVTEADWKHWSSSELAPYLEVVLNAFGSQRLMIGTDWPVLTLECTYAQWWQTVERWIAPLTTSEQTAILGGTATRVYRLTDAAYATSSLKARELTL